MQPVPRAPADTAALLASAAQLRAATGTRPLRGKNIALLSSSADAPAAQAVLAAAAALGAQAVHVRLDSLPPGHLTETLTLLGRLYDGIVTDGVPPALCRQLEHLVDRPIVDQAFAAALAVAGQDGDVDGVLQAVLVQGLA